MTSNAPSPFKKLYSTEKLEDGNVLIRYKKKNFWFGPYMALFLSVLAGTALSSIVALVLQRKAWAAESVPVDLFFLVLGAVGAFLFLSKFFWLEQKIVVKPGETITANGKTFPLKDLDKMWVQSSLDGEHFAVVVSGRGQEFAITGTVKSETLAEAIKKEIWNVTFALV